MRRSWGAILLLIFPLAALASGTPNPRYALGKDYQLIQPRPSWPVHAPKGKIQVAEMFWYQCPHCAHFEPKLQHWLQHDKSPAVDFVRIPAVVAPNWFFMARVYYTAVLLGDQKIMTPVLFKAIQAKGPAVENFDGVARLFAQHGVSQPRFKAAFRSLAVETRVREAIQLTREYGVGAVPMLIVDGRYRVDPNQAGSYARMLRITNYLVNKLETERRARRSPSKPGA